MEKENLQCIVCCTNGKKNQPRFDTVDILRSHITTVHCSWVPYECVLCPLMFMPTETVLKHHYQQTHPDDVPKAIYTYEEDKKRKVKQMLNDSLHLQSPNECTVMPAIGVEMPQEKCNCDNNIVPSNLNIQTTLFAATENQLEATTTEYKFNVIESNHSARIDNSDFAIEVLPSQKETQEATETENSPDGLKKVFRNFQIPKRTNKRQMGPKIKQSKASALGQGFEGTEREESQSFSTSTKRGRPDAWCYICSEYIVSKLKPTHVWSRHMPRKRMTCNSCNYKTNHLKGADVHRKRTEHSWTDNKQLLYAVYKRAFIDAFGSYYNDNKDRELNRKLPPVELRDRGEEIKCKLCGEWTADRLEHVRTHLPQVFRCQMEKCTFQLHEWNETEAIHHLTTAHPGVETLVAKWNLETDKKQQDETLSNAFG